MTIYKIISDHYEFEQDAKYWKKKNKRIYDKIVSLVISISIDPYFGIGKPEPLKGTSANHWSRRINKEHRLVYLIEGNTIYLIQCRFHYD